MNINQKLIENIIIPEGKNIISIGLNILGKEIFLSKKCASAWDDMQKAADAVRESLDTGKALAHFETW